MAPRAKPTFVFSLLADIRRSTSVRYIRPGVSLKLTRRLTVDLGRCSSALCPS